MHIHLVSSKKILRTFKPFLRTFKPNESDEGGNLQTYIYFNNKKELNTGSHPVSEILYVCEGLHPLSFV